jgi:phosphomannomutase
MPHLNADLGAVVNIDGDRCAFLTESGQALSEEYTLPMAVMGLIAKRPGGVVTNLSSSSMIDAVVKQSGGRVVRTSVGEASVISAAVTRGMRLAGEGSGTIAAPPEVNSFDAILALLSVLEQLALGNVSMSQLASSLPVSHMCKGQVEMPPTSSYQLLDLLRKYYEDEQPSMQDGIRVEWPDKWLHIRASNTEPLLRMICEADTLEKAQQLYSETMSLVNRFAASGGVRHA